MKLHLVSLGCARNLVDSETMLGRLIGAGWIITQDPAQADTIIVNTCSFIESAVDESIDTILELAQLKHHGSCRRLIVAGCLPQRYREEIAQTLPEVDVFLGTGAYDKIVQAADGRHEVSGCYLPDPNSSALQGQDAPRIQSSAHMAYLKVSEGCNRFCTYCIIPRLRGKQKSRLPDAIITEARNLVLSGVNELILIAQDTTAYGQDLDPPTGLSGLIETLAGISDSVWLRILYGHPESIDTSVIRTIADHPNVCSYFDIPIQHASSRILRKMGRKYTRHDLRRLFAKVRSLCPDAALRTTAIVGFPGETDTDFEQLLNFVKDIRFDHLGVFVYSDSEDLPSHKLADHVPPPIARQRYDRLMSCQAEISYVNNQKYIGRTYKVLVEKQENRIFHGRTTFQAPEVDGITTIKTGHLSAGGFCDVKIIEASEYDLVGESV